MLISILLSTLVECRFTIREWRGPVAVAVTLAVTFVCTPLFDIVYHHCTDQMPISAALAEMDENNVTS